MVGVLLLVARLLTIHASAIQAALPFRESLESIVPLRQRSSPLPSDAATDPIAAAGSQTALSGSCEAVRPAVVTIYAGREIGSGSILTPQGLVLTSLHVVSTVPDHRVRVKLSNQALYPAAVAAIDRVHDLALLQLETTDRLPTLRLGTAAQLVDGQMVCAIGSPFGKSGTLSQGRLEAILPTGAVKSELRLHPGDSGGPLLNQQGELIGVNRAILKSRGGQNAGISFATPLVAIQSLLDRYVRLPASPLQPSSTVASALPVPSPPNSSSPTFPPPNQTPAPGARLGVVLDQFSLTVEQVREGSPAARAGLRIGDRLLAIDGKTLDSIEMLQAVLRRQPQTAVLTLNRQQQQTEVQVNF
jgi:serine protease Do